MWPIDTIQTAQFANDEIPRIFAGISFYASKEIRYADQIVFDEESHDKDGMPQASISYEITERDHKSLKYLKSNVAAAASALGTLIQKEPNVLPPGSSLHYQGTTRIGDSERESVCDSFGRVWGIDNLYVGGNGLIATATACNPTLTSIALALRSCSEVVRVLQR
jgi:pyranose oxidase